MLKFLVKLPVYLEDLIKGKVIQTGFRNNYNFLIVIIAWQIKKLSKLMLS